MFFGTPHHGSSKARMLGTLQKLASITVPRRIVQVESDLVSALNEESETLQNITDYFVPLMKNFCIYFFWEQEKTDLGYALDYIVTKESAVPNVDDTEKSGIAADHTNMVKFDQVSSPGFRLVVAALLNYCEEAPEVIQSRWADVMQSRNEERRRAAMEKLRRLQGLSPVPIIPFVGNQTMNRAIEMRSDQWNDYQQDEQDLHAQYGSQNVHIE